MPKNDYFYDKFKEKVIDGTRCNDDTYDMCADGVCKVLYSPISNSVLSRWTLIRKMVVKPRRNTHVTILISPSSE